MRSPINSKRHDLRAIARRALLARGFLPEFSPQALDEAEAIPDAAHGQHRGRSAIRDLRELLWSSIDNDDSRDLDQLEVAEPQADESVKILVAIADVDALVKKGSAIDEHAHHNTTSIYTAAAIFPMLPERLSTDLTSLSEHQDRLAIVTEMWVAPDGSLRGSDIYPALVRNHAKLAYNSVARWLDDEGPMPPAVQAKAGMEEQLRVQDRIAQAMKMCRHQHGALQLETIEPRAVFKDDVLTDLRIDPKNRAKEMIEDFMIATNGVAARYLDQKGFPSLRRVLRSPKRWAKIVSLAAELGERLPAEPDAAALESFLYRRKQAAPDRFADLSLSIVKLMGSGEYVLEHAGSTPPGHFGLAVRDYTHSTAPNRRFPDLLTQRLLKAAMAGHPPPYRGDELPELAAYCTRKEDDASKVERQVRKSAAALLLDGQIGRRFDAIVTGASDKGTWARLCHPVVEGRVVRGFERLDVGDRVQVELLSADVERGYIDFAAVR